MTAGPRLPNRLLWMALAAVMLLPLATADASAQCAMCRSVLASPEGQRMVGALRSGILLLLAAPFAVFGTVAVLAVRTQRRRHAQEDARE